MTLSAALGSETPVRLTHDDEAALALRIRAGDDDAFATLVRANLGLVFAVVKQFQDCGLENDDLVGEGNLALIRAAQAFDERKGFRFSTFATTWIHKSIIQAINAEQRHRSLAEHVDAGVAESVSQPPEPDEDELRADARKRDFVAGALMMLPEREAMLLRMAFGIGDGQAQLSYAEIGREVGLTPQRVHQLVTKALEKLRIMFGDMEAP